MFGRAQELLQQTLGSGAQFREGQWEAIQALVEWRERVLVVQRTGWGKSLVYFLATRLLRDLGGGPTLLVSPLLSLMRNQIQAARALRLRAETINSDNYADHAEIERRLLSGEIDLLLISPERLANAHFQDEVWSLLKDRIGLLVVDEAHCISDWGHDFRPNYRRILHILRDLADDTPILGTTATANTRVIDDVGEILGNKLRVLRGALARESLALHVLPAPQSAAWRLVALAQLLDATPGSGIIYCTTTEDCVRVANWLREQGHNVKPYYAAVTQDTGEDRADLEQQLLDNRVKALVASVALGMGFDKPDLHFVIHYQFPGSIVSYYQQIGRAGRGIAQASIILMHGTEDESIQQYFIETAFPKAEHIDQALDALREHGELSFFELQRHVNVRYGTLEKIIMHLELEGVIQRAGRGYRRTPIRRAPDYVRWAGVTAQRYRELAQMQAYMQHDGCLMRFIAAALDDHSLETPCGKCQNCTGRSLALDPTPQEVDAASRFLRTGEWITLEARKQWPSGVAAQGKSKIALPNETGIALCYYHDGGWGEVVQSGKYRDGHYSDALVRAAADLLRDWFDTLDAPPEWITPVPSLRRPLLVPDFASRLAKALGLGYWVAVRKTADRPEQKTMQNSYQQVVNLQDSFALVPDQLRDTPVLLVDDMTDSGWTFTVIGDLLRQAGSGPVIPFALAKVGAGAV
jgi:ATP-dependent DNA helicase RecQ